MSKKQTTPASLYIPSIDAKDLYLANHSCLSGYCLTTQTREPNYRKFASALDFSLDLEKLREIAGEVYGDRHSFSFWHNGREYSDKVINVTFHYSSKEFNQIKKDTYVMEGYRLEDLEFSDHIAADGEQIVGIVVSAPVQEPAALPLPDGFSYETDPKGHGVYALHTQKVTCSRRDLRDSLYEHGFFCNGLHYVRFKRTSGSARLGKCLFLEESLYPRFHEWELCGLTVPAGSPVDLAALESYLSLPTSSAIGVLKIDPKSILIAPDCESRFREASVLVELDADKHMTAREGEAEIANSIFDGQSLIDTSLMGAYAPYGMVLLRNRFFKSCCFHTRLQQWFSDQGITSLNQLHPQSITLAERIEDIKLVTTPSSVKYAKFAPLEQWLRQIEPTFGVVKHEKKTHFFDGRLVQAHYQLLNTLQLSKEDIHALLAPSLHYVNLLHTDPDVFKYHVKCSVLEETDTERDFSNVMEDKHDLIYTMLKRSALFPKTKYFYDFKKETCKAYLKNLKKGHLLINGNYSVLFGNPYEMLLHTIGRFDAASGETSLPPGYLHTTRYPYGTHLLGCRSPHISTSNLLVSTNLPHEEIDRYFHLTEEIVCINSIRENILERLSGADFDSDMMILTDNDILIRAALKNYRYFHVPANLVKAAKSKRCYTPADQSDLDYRTSENKIGEIVNLSQELNSLLWDTVNQLSCEEASFQNEAEDSQGNLRSCYKKIQELYLDICILNVLSCIEIDKAKKEFELSSNQELSRIKKKWQKSTVDGRAVKPAFLGFIASVKGYRNPEKKSYRYYQTSMDFLLEELNHYRSKKTKTTDLLPLSECFRFPGFQPNSVHRKQTSRIVSLCEETVSAIQAVWAKGYYTAEEAYTLTQAYKDDLAAQIQKMKLNPHTLFTLITFTDKKKYAGIARLLFYALFHYENAAIIELMKQSRTPVSYIKEAPQGELQGELELYGIPFRRYGGDVLE